jgi:hypothetical protein
VLYHDDLEVAYHICYHSRKVPLLLVRVSIAVANGEVEACDAAAYRRNGSNT